MYVFAGQMTSKVNYYMYNGQPVRYLKNHSMNNIVIQDNIYLTFTLRARNSGMIKTSIGCIGIL